MKKISLILLALQLPVDYIMLLIAATSAYFLRYSQLSTQVRPITFDLPLSPFILISLILGLFWILIFAWFGLYTNKRLKFTQELSKIVQGSSMAIMLITSYMFFVRELFSSRFIILTTWILSMILVLIGRLAIKYLQRYIYAKGIEVYNTIIIGKTKITETFAQEFKNKPSHGIKIIDTLDKNHNILSKIKTHKNVITKSKHIYNIKYSTFILIPFNQLDIK